MVDVGPFHDHDFPGHAVVADGVAGRGVGFVAVDAFEFDGLVVDVEVASGEVEFVVFGFGLADFDLAESGVGRYGFEGLSFFVKKLGYKDVACGVFGAPEVGAL